MSSDPENTIEKLTSKPSRKKILDDVVPHVAQDWYVLGVKLLNENEEPQLDVIRSNGTNTREFCMEMFWYWLKTDTNASWKKLIDALKSPAVNLHVTADNLERMLTGNSSIDEGDGRGRKRSDLPYQETGNAKTTEVSSPSFTYQSSPPSGPNPDIKSQDPSMASSSDVTIQTTTKISLSYVDVATQTTSECIRDYTNIKQEKKVIDKYGPADQKFFWPYLLAKGLNGEVMVGNSSDDAKHVAVFDEGLQYLRAIGSNGYGNGKFQGVCGIAVNERGFLYISDGPLHCIQKFTLHDGKFVSQFGKEGTANGEFQQPTGLLISKSNLLFVCDRRNHRIQVFYDKDFLNFLYTFGKKSTSNREPGTFNEPVDLAMNNTEQMLFITDWRNDRIQVFEPNGKFLRQIKTSADNPFQLCTPNGICFTPDDYILVSSTNLVLIFKEDGTFVSAIEGIYNNTRGFTDCIGVTMMNDGRIVVADGRRGTNRLIVF